MYLPVEPGRLIRGQKIEDALYIILLKKLRFDQISSSGKSGTC